MRTEITAERARVFTPPPGREAVLWDTIVQGLGLRIRPTGRRTWIVHRRLRGGVVKRTLGPLDALTIDDARQDARALIAGAAAGGDVPAPLMRTFVPAFLADCGERWKPATRASHAQNLRGLVLPAFGTRRVDSLTPRDVRSWFDEQSARRPASANRALAVLSALMKHAEALGLRPEGSNPCRGLRRRKSRFEARYLTDDEFASLGRALDRMETVHPVAVAALRFLLYTGARKSEALGLKWEHVHDDRAVLPDSKTGARTIWLAAPARALLAALPRAQRRPAGVRVPHGQAGPDREGMEDGAEGGRPRRDANPRLPSQLRGGRGRERRRVADRRGPSRPRRHQDHVRLHPSRRGHGLRGRGPGLADTRRRARRSGRRPWLGASI